MGSLTSQHLGSREAELSLDGKVFIGVRLGHIMTTLSNLNSNY